ncbi:MAG: hypothetical protein M3433_03305 [Actinomycetota bacterium]|nr:hypothetical protein [Actinomycetota bacterium]
MTDVETLLNEYIAEHRRGGETEPRAYLERVAGAQRSELAALIDAYLSRAPRQEWDRAAYDRSRAPEMVEALAGSLQGASGLWPSLLPRLRNRARVARSELVAELAARLGAEGQREKVGRYYHQMETGRLPAEGVSDSVLEALGQIVGQSRGALRRAGEAFGPGAGPAPEAEAFARATTAPAGSAGMADAEEPAETPAAAHWDEVDRLFRGG